MTGRDEIKKVGELILDFLVRLTGNVYEINSNIFVKIIIDGYIHIS